MKTAGLSKESRGSQIYEEDFLQSIIDHYPISGDIEEYYRFDLGFEDTNYFVRINGNRYVVKVFETPDVPIGSISFKVEVMDMVYRAGIKSPRVHRNNDDSRITYIDGKRVVLMDFVEGENMAKSRFTDDLIYELGQQAGKMDSVLSGISNHSRLDQNFPLDLSNFLDREGGVNVLPTAFDRVTFLDVFENFKKIKATFDTLPSGVIHHDIVAHNVIAEDGTLAAIIDFSDVVHAPYAQNVAATLCQTTFWYNWQPHQAGTFLRGYRESHEFSREEESLLFDLTHARYVSLIIGLNNRNVRYGDDPNRTKYLWDRYEYLQRLIEFGRTRFDEALLEKN